MDKLCIGWDTSPHHVLRVQTVEVAGVATMQLCPLCLFCLSWDQRLEGAVELVDDDAMGGIDGMAFSWSYLDPLPKEQDAI